MNKRVTRSLAAILTLLMVLSLFSPALAARPMMAESEAVEEIPAVYEGDHARTAWDRPAAEEPAELFAASLKSAGGDLESAYMEWYPNAKDITYTVSYRSNGGSWVTLTDDDTYLIGSTRATCAWTSPA